MKGPDSAFDAKPHVPLVTISASPALAKCVGEFARRAQAQMFSTRAASDFSTKRASTVSSRVMSVEVSAGLPEEFEADLKWVMGKVVDEKVDLRTLALYVYSTLQST